MNKEDRILLVRDVMARLPYDPKFDLNGIRGSIHHISIYTAYSTSGDMDYICSADFFGDGNYIDIEHFKPILYPIQSMTEEQKKEYLDLLYIAPARGIDYLNEHMFDYRCLIPKGLAKDGSKLNAY